MKKSLFMFGIVLFANSLVFAHSLGLASVTDVVSKAASKADPNSLTATNKVQDALSTQTAQNVQTNVDKLADEIKKDNTSDTNKNTQ